MTWNTISIWLAMAAALGTLVPQARADTGEGESPLFSLNTTIGTFDDSPLFSLNTTPGTGVKSPAPSPLREFWLEPNPFNPTTTVRFDLTQGGVVSLRVHDARGRLVRRLISRRALPSGSHDFVWRGIDDAGRPVASGVYRLRLLVDGYTHTRTATLIK